MTDVLASAAPLLNFIGKTETGKTGPEAYLVVYGNRQGRLAKPITTYTLDDLLAAQKVWGKNWGSSAAGKYQIIRATLLGLMKDMGVEGSRLFTPELQDAMGYQLLVRRGFPDFAAGKLSFDDFALAMAKEWASMPVLKQTQGKSRVVERGQSYYAGDGLNKALVTPGVLMAELSNVLNRTDAAPAPIPAPAPSPSPVPAAPDQSPEPEPSPSTVNRGAMGWAVFVIIIATGVGYGLAKLNGWI